MYDSITTAIAAEHRRDLQAQAAAHRAARTVARRRRSVLRVAIAAMQPRMTLVPATR
ncbi:hypothetical protein [Pseudonocardia sp. TRM90224]|uniref:hypothetical protein n=1 Tax=Pseudonocardia sp. TRM90224 TaxID=2812678 RepID=UPI001E486255|nr:hypothetical protein [Pseudonocardia sp. TRM90224]